VDVLRAKKKTAKIVTVLLSAQMRTATLLIVLGAKVSLACLVMCALLYFVKDMK